MSRWTIFCLAALLAAGDALAADQAPPTDRGAQILGARSLPSRPRVHAHGRTTRVVVEPEAEALISMPTTPLLPGSSALPGYYGRAFSYNYQGAYYGGSSSYVPYFFRMPYACGVTGYC